jgi:hypothetical protein
MKLTLEEKEIKELEGIITEIPYKYAQPLLAYLSKFVKPTESVNLEDEKDEIEMG